MSFEEFLKKQQTTIPTIQPAGIESGFDAFLKRQQAIPTAIPVKVPTGGREPFAYRKGLLQTVFKAPISLGKTLARPFVKRTLEEAETNLKMIAERIDKSNLEKRQKQILANMLDTSGLKETLEKIAPAKTPIQIAGDIVGTALFIAPIGAGIKGITIAGQLTRGAVIGAGFGAAEALSEGDDISTFLKKTATGAVIGAPAEVLGIAGIKVAGKVAQFAKQKIGGLFKKIQPKFLMSVGRRLEKDYGEEGKEIAEKFLSTDRNTLQRVGGKMDELQESGLFDLDDNSVKQLSDALEGRIKEIPENIRKPFEVIDRLRTEIAQEAQSKKLKIRIKAGKEFPFHPRANWTPHPVPELERLQTGIVREQVLDNAVRIGKFTNKKEAAKVLDSYIEFATREGRGGEFWVDYLVNSGQAKTKDQARGMTLRFFKASRLKRFGSLEKAREIDFPFYDPDLRRTIPFYTMGSIQRLEEVTAFGGKFEKIDRLIGAIKRKQGIDDGRRAASLVKAARGLYEGAPGREKASLFLRTVQIPKLAFSQILNAGQTINTLLSTDIPTTFRAIALSFRDEGIRRGLKSGATLEQILRETRQVAGGSTEFANKFLRITGFSAVEKFNRTVAANAGYLYAQKTFKKLLKNPTDKIFRARLGEIGIDAEKALQKGVLDEKELLMAAQRISEATQFRARPIDLPEFYNSPEGKILFQFKTFAYNHAKFLRNRFQFQIKNKNYTGLARDILVLSTIFPMTGEVISDIRSILSGQKRPTKFFERYLEDIMVVGGIGIYGDVVQSARWGRLWEFIGGPSLQTGVETMERITQVATGKRKPAEADLKFILRQTGFGRTLANYAFPNDRKNQKTFLETLEDFADEF